MIKAIIFDYFGVINPGGLVDQALLDYILGLRKSYKTGLLTNISAGGLDRLFAPGEIEKYFDYAAASGDIGFTKPHERAYEIVAERLGMPIEACIMVDDREICCTGATQAGMQAILYVSLTDLKQKISERTR